MLSDVLLHNVFVDLPYRLGKIPIRPKAVSPQKFFQFRKFFPQDSTRPPFENLDYLGHATVQWYLHNSVHMIILNAHLADPPVIHFARLIHEVLEADGNFAL